MNYKKILDENNENKIQLLETKEVVIDEFSIQQLLVKKVKFEKEIENIDNKILKVIEDTDIKQKDFYDKYQEIVDNNLWI